MIAIELRSWEIAEDVSAWIEVAAIVVITAWVVIAVAAGGRAGIRGTIEDAAHVFRARIADGLLVGLDLLIAADIIRTVTLELTLENVAALGLIVVVRTLLSWTLVVEHEHRWPWQAVADGGGD